MPEPEPEPESDILKIFYGESNLQYALWNHQPSTSTFLSEFNESTLSLIGDAFIPNAGDKTFDGISIRRLCSFVEESYRSSKLYRLYFVSANSYAFIDKDFEDQTITEVQYYDDTTSVQDLYLRTETDERHLGKDIFWIFIKPDEDVITLEYSDNHDNKIIVEQGSQWDISFVMNYNGYRTTQGVRISDASKFTINQIGYDPINSSSVVDLSFKNTSDDVSQNYWSAVKNFDTTKDQIDSLYQTNENTITNLDMDAQEMTVSLKLVNSNTLPERWILPSNVFSEGFDGSYVMVSDFELYYDGELVDKFPGLGTSKPI